MIRGLVLIAVLLVSEVAYAQPGATADTPAVQTTVPRRRAVSVGLWSLSGLAGLQGQFEQQVTTHPHWSWIAGGGFRFSARSDYSSSTLAAGGEARYWFKRRAVWTDAPRGSMIGWYVGGRLDLAWTRTHDDIDDRTIGHNLATALMLSGGYRFVVRRKVEITPMIAIGANRDKDLRGRLPGLTRGTARLGMTVGWMF